MMRPRLRTDSHGARGSSSPTTTATRFRAPHESSPRFSALNRILLTPAWSLKHPRLVADIFRMDVFVSILRTRYSGNVDATVSDALRPTNAARSFGTRFATSLTYRGMRQQVKVAVGQAR
jgi:hypothetical protein